MKSLNTKKAAKACKCTKAAQPPANDNHPVAATGQNLAKLLDDTVAHHPALQELETFGCNLQSRPLSKAELKIFLASLAAFVGDIPGGILSLGLRITDELMAERDRLNATAEGALILFAAVDEYGLHEMQAGPQRTHHQLYIDVLRHFGITVEDMLDEANILPEGKAMGRRTAEYYRWRSVPEAMGFHFASEATSNIEFGWYLAGFKTFAEEYGLLADGAPAPHFFVIHTEVEPGHRDMGREIIKRYARTHKGITPAVVAGITAFLDGYGALFAALNRRLFNA